MSAPPGSAPGIAGAFAAARGQNRCAFIPFVVAGDPDLAATRSIARALTRAGADLLEIGVPFSDPIADGEVNQRAAERALRRGVTLGSCLDLAADLKSDGAPPIVLFTYYNPIHRMGLDRFARAAGASGVAGVLVTDLPPEEADELRKALQPHGVDLIFLLSPTSSPERIELVGRQARGFLYFISRTGVTGSREGVPAGLPAQVAAARTSSSVPVAVGFGIGGASQAGEIAAYADGIVVGSALVRIIEEHAGSPDLDRKIEEFCGGLKAALRWRANRGS